MSNHSQRFAPLASPTDQLKRTSSLQGAAWENVLGAYCLTLIVVSLGVLVGFSLLSKGQSIPYGKNDYLLRFAAWDGGQFMQIVEHGYQYDPAHISNIIMFPGLPLLARGLVILTGCSPIIALLGVAHTFLILTYILLYRYVCERSPSEPALAEWTILAFSLFPTTFYFRMAYSESMFLFFVLLMFHGMQRRWPIVVLAFIAGTCTGVRLVGIALVFPLILHIFRREKHLIDRLAQLAISLPIAAWGLSAFMLFQWMKFDEPLAFMKAQENLLLRPDVSFPVRMLHLLTGEPIWGNYLSDSSAYWFRYSPKPMALLNMQFSNPIYFCASVLALLIGWFKRFLNAEEAILTAALLAIPYFSRSYVFCMGSQGRYAAAAFPLFIVWGQLLRRLPLPIGLSILGIWGFLLAMYAAFFASWYFFL